MLKFWFCNCSIVTHNLDTAALLWYWLYLHVKWSLDETVRSDRISFLFSLIQRTGSLWVTNQKKDVPFDRKWSKRSNCLNWYKEGVNNTDWWLVLGNSVCTCAAHSHLCQLPCGLNKLLCPSAEQSRHRERCAFCLQGSTGDSFAWRAATVCPNSCEICH